MPDTGSQATSTATTTARTAGSTTERRSRYGRPGKIYKTSRPELSTPAGSTSRVIEKRVSYTPPRAVLAKGATARDDVALTRPTEQMEADDGGVDGTRQEHR